MSIKISIITVCKNSVNTIRDTIDSVLFQQYPALEYIIIDGASTDGTLDYILRYGSKIDHVISESDDGIYEGMNKGISLANGDLIGFLNSDDCYSNNNVLNQVARVFEEESIMACYAQLCYVDFKNTDRVVRYWKSSSFRPFDFKKGSDRSDRVGPERVIERGYLNEREILRGVYFLLFLSVILGLYLVKIGGVIILLIGLSSFLFAYLYTATKFSIAYNGLGEVYVFIYFGIRQIMGVSFWSLLAPFRSLFRPFLEAPWKIVQNLVSTVFLTFFCDFLFFVVF